MMYYFKVNEKEAKAKTLKTYYFWNVKFGV